MAGTLFAIIFAVIFCVSFANFLESVFHMTTAIANGLTNSFHNEALLTPLPSEISGADIKSALEGMQVPLFWRWIISGAFSSVETIPEGTTPAMMLGSTLAKWFSIAIAFVLLVVLIKLAAVLLDKGLSGLVEKCTPFRVVNQLLGALLGLVKAGIAVFLILAVCSLDPRGRIAFVSFLDCHRRPHLPFGVVRRRNELCDLGAMVRRLHFSVSILNFLF